MLNLITNAKCNNIVFLTDPAAKGYSLEYTMITATSKAPRGVLLAITTWLHKPQVVI